MTCPHNYIIDKWELEHNVLVLQVKCSNCGHEAIVPNILDDEKMRLRQAIDLNKAGKPVPWDDRSRIRKKGEGYFK